MMNENELLMLSPAELRASELNPRKRFLQSSLVEMADSIGVHGVQVPVRGRYREDGKVEVIWGERRMRGAMLVFQGYEDGEGQVHPPREDLRVPVLVGALEDDEVFELMMLENLQREDLTPSEEGAGYVRMMEMRGLSQREVAQRLGVAQRRVGRLAGLMSLPAAVRERVDAGELPLYVALEALRVPAEWLGGDARAEALRVAEEAGSRDRAHELVEARFLRPAREMVEWEAEERMEGLRARHGEDVERLSYRVCRELFPPGVTVLTPVTAGLFVRGDEVPSPPTVHVVTGWSWLEMARMWGAPVYVGCDGAMEEVVLCRSDLVAEAARTRHTMEVEVVPDGDGWCWSVEDGGLSEGDRVALLKLSGAGDVPPGFGPGRLYSVAGMRRGEDVSLFDLADVRGAVVPLHGMTRVRMGLLDVARCPFLPGEGRLAAAVARSESDEAAAKEDVAARARAAEVADMVGRAVMAIRGEVESGGGDDGMLAMGVQFLAVAGAIGMSHEVHPGNRLMEVLGIPEEGPDEGQFATWPGLSGPDVSRAGVESFAVGAWLLYFLEGFGEGDLEGCEQWGKVRGRYGV